MSSSVAGHLQRPSLIGVSEITPPISSPVDAEVDLEVLRVVSKQFEINDEKSASWLVRKIVAAREYGTRVKEWAERERRRAEREEQTLMFLFGRQIEDWAKGEIERLGGKRKSIALPGGTVAYRTVNSCLRIDDEDSAMSWARTSCPAAIVVIERLSKSVVADHFKSTGEVPDGTHIELERESFSIK